MRQASRAVLARDSDRAGLQAQYIYDRAMEDPDSALDLIELEQIRLIEFLSVAFDTQRKEESRTKLPDYQESFKALEGIVRETISDLSIRRKLTPESYDRLNHLLNLQHCLEAASEAIGGLSKEFQALRQSHSGARFVESAVEGQDAIVLSLLDFARERSGGRCPAAGRHNLGGRQRHEGCPFGLSCRGERARCRRADPTAGRRQLLRKANTIGH